MPNLIFACPVALGDHYDVPVDQTDWLEPFNYHQIPGQGQTPHRPRAPFRSHLNSLVPRSQVANFDDIYGVYILAVDHPQKAFYVGIAAASGKTPEGVGSRIRKHRVKLTASHVGPTLHCGSPAGVGGVHHPEKWRRFGVLRHQFHYAAEAEDRCADVRLMVGTAGDNDKRALEQFESAILYNAGGVLNRIFDLLWPDEDNSSVAILNASLRGGTGELTRRPHLAGGLHGKHRYHKN